MDWGEQAERRERLGRADSSQSGEWIVVVEDFERIAVPSGYARAALGLDADDADQYVARPPEMS
jgi:hypothetical protein